MIPLFFTLPRVPSIPQKNSSQPPSAQFLVHSPYAFTSQCKQSASRDSRMAVVVGMGIIKAMSASTIRSSPMPLPYTHPNPTPCFHPHLTGPLLYMQNYVYDSLPHYIPTLSFLKTFLLWSERGNRHSCSSHALPPSSL